MLTPRPRDSRRPSLTAAGLLDDGVHEKEKSEHSERQDEGEQQLGFHHAAAGRCGN